MQTSKPVAASNFNPAVFFISVFRWALVAFFGFLIKAQFETTLIRACDATHCTSLGLNIVSPGIIALWDTGDWSLASVREAVASAFSNIHWPFLTGILQGLITAIFAIRYTLCLIDPLERRVGLLGEKGATVETLDEGEVEKRLGIARSMLVAFVVFAIGIPELMFLFHAASSVAFDQWAVFLLLLVIWDSFMFFLFLPTMFKDPQQTKREKALNEIASELKRVSLKLSRTPLSVDVSELTSRKADLLNQQEKLEREGREGLGSAFARYSRWNLLDLLSIACFCLLHHWLLHWPGVGDGQDGWSFMLLSLTLVVIWWASSRNYRKDPTTWHTHLTVLRLARVPAGAVRLSS